MIGSSYVDKKTAETLDYYVYCLIDPTNLELFYIGQGKGNRVDDHEFEGSDSVKNNRLSKINRDGLSVHKIIICHNLSKQEAEKIESVLITMLQTKRDRYSQINLLNIQGGKHQDEMFITLDEINALYGSKPFDPTIIKHHILCININQTFWQTNSLPAEEKKKQLYYATRGKWIKLSKTRAEQQDLVFAECNGIVRSVYKPTKWQYDFEDDEFKMVSDPQVPKICFEGEDVSHLYPEYMNMRLEKKSRTTSRFKYLRPNSGLQ